MTKKKLKKKKPSLTLEKRLTKSSYKSVAGLDEAGRGPWAGPVVAAAVHFPLEPSGFLLENLEFIRDSKKLTPKKREEIFEILINNLPDYAVGKATHEEIDKLNILQATRLAMQRAVDSLKTRPDFILVDGFDPKLKNLPAEAITKGEDVSLSIAAASIIAKVARDRMMEKFDQEYPEYEFKKHKGYGTKIHQEALEKHGASPIHRRTFVPIKKIIKEHAR